MGPPSEDGGNILALVLLGAVLTMLQWGRRPRTAEIYRAALRSGPKEMASMGPPSEDGGNSSTWSLPP